MLQEVKESLQIILVAKVNGYPMSYSLILGC